MMEYLIAQALGMELALGERQNNQRREWHALATVDRLESALRLARTRIHNLIPLAA